MVYSHPIHPLPVGSLQLGRLVLDTSNPNQNYQDPVIEPEVTITSSPRLPLITSWSITDSQAWFENACRQKDTRDFLELAYAYFWQVDLVVGFHTMKPARGPVIPSRVQGGEAELAREIIVAIVYCKVGFNRFPACRVNGPPKATNIWKIRWDANGAQYGSPGDIPDEDAYFLQVHLVDSNYGWINIHSETEPWFVNSTATDELPLSNETRAELQIEFNSVRRRMEMMNLELAARDRKQGNSARSKSPVPASSNTNTSTINRPEITVTRLVSPNEIKSVHDLTASSTVSPDHSWAIRFHSGKRDISFLPESQRSFANDLKGWIEDLIREPINWWPFAPRRYPLPENQVFVDWKCNCGKRLFDVVLRKRMIEYNLWLSASNQPSSPTNDPSAVTAIESEGSAKAQIPLANMRTLPTAKPPSTKSSSSMAPTAPSTTSAGTDLQLPLLLWCINLSSQLTLGKSVKICPGDRDKEMFQKLRMKYWKVRGWRRWFSLYIISSIKFVKFRPYRKKHVDCLSKEDVPCPKEPHYEYNPHPPEDMPPVSTRLLMEYFGDPTCAGTSAAVLEAFPKRITGKLNHMDKYGWGLHACEHLSFVRVSILSMVVLVGPLWFFVYWLLSHPGDLQNASVPMFLAFSVIGTFIILPHYFG